MKRTLQSELAVLEKITSTAKPRSAEELQLLIKNQVENIKDRLLHEVENSETNSYPLSSIRQFQREIVRILDNEYFHTKYSKTKKPNRRFTDALDELLRFAEIQCPTYFDDNYRAPARLVAPLQQQLRDTIAIFETDLLRKGADADLVQLVLRVVIRVAEANRNCPISFHELNYANEMRIELTRLLNPKYGSDSINDYLRQLTFYLNYNSGRVVQYYEKQIQTMLEKVETRNERIEKLSFLLKTINQAHLKNGIKYDPTAESLTTRLSIYINEEIEYTEKVSRMASYQKDSSDSEITDFKLKFEVSVPQLAYLTKVFIDQKIILNTNMTQVLNFLSRVIVTKKAEAVSYTSIRSKFYNVEDATKKSVKTLLQRLIQHIESN